MKINDLLIVEKRRNPEHPAQKETRIPSRSRLKKYAGKKYFITFSNLPKTGLNPESKYNTPIGIYTYPMEEFKDIWSDHFQDTFPFAADRPFIYVLEEKNKPLTDMEKYTDQDWEKDKQKLAELTDNTPEEIEHLLDDEISHFNDGSPITKLWRFTRWLSKKTNKPQVKWNKILAALGYSGFIDRGKGLIHENEPIQAFFVSSKYYDVVEQIDNKNSRHDPVYYEKMRKLPTEFKKVLKQMNRASTDQEKARILEKSRYGFSYQKFKMPFSDNLKKEFLRIGIPVNEISFGAFKDIYDEQGSHVFNYLKNPTVEQVQYAIDNTKIMNMVPWVRYKDDLVFSKSKNHYDFILTSDYLNYFEKIELVGDFAFYNTRNTKVIFTSAINGNLTDFRHFLENIKISNVDSPLLSIILYHIEVMDMRVPQKYYDTLIQAHNNIKYESDEVKEKNEKIIKNIRT